MATIALPRPHAAQRQVIKEAKRFNCVICGRRWGKSILGEDRAVEPALAGYPVAWLAPTYKMLAPIWRSLCTILKPIAKQIDKTEKRIELITGGSLEFWSLDNPDAPRGRKYARIIWDEAAMHKNPETFPTVIRPLLTDYRGDLWLLTTPRGRDWVWECFQRGLDPYQPDWACWQMPTLSNPFIHPDEIKEAEALLSKRFFEQEYLAQFLENGSGVFRGLDRVCVAEEESEPQPDYRYTFGIDWGKSNDFTAISIMKWQPFNRDFKPTQVRLDRFNQISWEFQKQRLLSLAQKWQPSQLLAEANSIGEPLIDALQRESINYSTVDPDELYINQPIEDRTTHFVKHLPISGFYTGAETKGPLIESYALAIEREEIILLNDPVQKGELSAYELERLPSGRYRYNAPPGMHDDTVIGGALGFQTCQRRGALSTAPNPFYF